MFSSIKNIVHKELLDAFRDRRSLLASLAFAVAGPLLIYVTLGAMAENIDRSSPVKVEVVGSENAPGLLSFLQQQNTAISEAPSNSATKTSGDGEHEVVMSIPKSYSEDYQAGRPASVEIYADYQSEQKQADAMELQRLVLTYGGKVSQARMLAQGNSPTRAIPISVNMFDLSTSGGLSARYAGMLGFLFLTAGFISGAFIIADTVAGERERHSLLPLMSQPVSPLALIIGKWFVAALVAGVVSTATVIASGYLLAISPIATVGLRFFTGLDVLLIAAICLLPLAGLAAAIQLFFVARSETYREAATYVQYTIFLPIIVVGVAQVSKFDFGFIASYLPITGQEAAIKSLLLNGQASLFPALATTLISVVATAALLWLTARTISNESTLR